MSFTLSFRPGRSRQSPALPFAISLTRSWRIWIETQMKPLVTRYSRWQACRRYEKSIEAMPFDLRKDIGWPGCDMQRRNSAP